LLLDSSANFSKLAPNWNIFGIHPALTLISSKNTNPNPENNYNTNSMPPFPHHQPRTSALQKSHKLQFSRNNLNYRTHKLKCEATPTSWIYEEKRK